MSLVEKKQTYALESAPRQNTQFVRIRGEAEVPADGISRVLCVQGHLDVDQAEALADEVQLGGTARFTVMYCNDAHRARSVTVQCPFQSRVPLAGVSPHMHIGTTCVLQEAESQLEGGLLRVEGYAALTVTAEQQEAVTLLTGLECGEDKPAPQMQIAEISAQRIVARGKQTRTILSDLMLPQRLPDIGEVLYCKPAVRVLETQRASGKLFVRGEAEVRLYYVCPQGDLYQTPLVWPFESALDLEGEDSADAEVFLKAEALSADCVSEADTDGSLRVLRPSITLSLNATCRLAVSLPLLQDAFVPNGHLDLETRRLGLAAPGISLTANEAVSFPLTAPEGSPAISRVLCTVCRPLHCAVVPERGQAQLEGGIAVTVLYQTAEDEGVAGFTQTVPYAITLRNDAFNEGIATLADVMVDEPTATARSGYEVDCRIPITVALRAFPEQPIAALTGAAMGEADSQPGLCALLFAQPGDSLWSMGKRYSISPASLQELNPHLEDYESDAELPMGERLVIYRSM